MEEEVVVSAGMAEREVFEEECEVAEAKREERRAMGTRERRMIAAGRE